MKITLAQIGAVVGIILSASTIVGYFVVQEHRMTKMEEKFDSAYILRLDTVEATLLGMTTKIDVAVNGINERLDNAQDRQEEFENSLMPMIIEYKARELMEAELANRGVPAAVARAIPASAEVKERANVWAAENIRQEVLHPRPPED